MKLYSIQDVWAAEARSEDSVSVPRAVRDAITKALEDGQADGLSLAERNRARALTAPRTSRVVAARVVAFFGTIEKADPDVPAFALHGGEAGRAWAVELEKGLTPAPREPDENDEHEDLRRRLGMLLGAHGDDGVPLEHFGPHVEKHGHKAVARALRDLGADHHQGRVTRKKPAPAKPEAEKASPFDQRPAKAKPAKKRAAAPPKASPAPIEKAHAEPTHAPTTWRSVRFRGLAR